MSNTSLVTALLAGVCLVCLNAVPAQAQLAVTINDERVVSPEDPFTDILGAIGDGKGEVGRLDLVNGASLPDISTIVLIGRDDGSGTLNIIEKSSIDFSSAEVGAAFNGKGEMSIQSGGKIEVISLDIGTFSGSVGNVTVSGSGSRIVGIRLNPTVNRLGVGWGGKGSLIIQDEAEVRSIIASIGEFDTAEGKLCSNIYLSNT